jgi:hypothetical protein
MTGSHGNRASRGNRGSRERAAAVDAMETAWHSLGTHVLHAPELTLRHLAWAWTTGTTLPQERRGPVLLAVLAAQPGNSLTVVCRCLLAADEFFHTGRYHHATVAAQAASRATRHHPQRPTPPAPAAPAPATGAPPTLEVERAATLRALQLTWSHLGRALASLHSDTAQHDTALWRQAHMPLSRHAPELLARVADHHHPHLQRGARLFAQALDDYLRGNGRNAAMAAGQAAVDAHAAFSAFLALTSTSRNPRHPSLGRIFDQPLLPGHDHHIVAVTGPPEVELS